jgi:hypothetical protein
VQNENIPAKSRQNWRMYSTAGWIHLLAQWDSWRVHGLSWFEDYLASSTSHCDWSLEVVHVWLAGSRGNIIQDSCSRYQHNIRKVLLAEWPEGLNH